jgi:hypothetical protein
MGWVWWHTPIIPTLRGLRLEELEFKGHQGYIVRPCVRKKMK